MPANHILNALAQARSAAPPRQGIGLGASVMTLDGPLPVEFLTPGDRLITRAGLRRLAAVEVSVIRGARMIAIAPRALGHDRPGAEVLVRPEQPVLIRDWRAQALYGQAQALVAAQRLVDGEMVRPVELQEARVFTLILEGAAVIYVDGLELACPAAEVSA